MTEIALGTVLEFEAGEEHLLGVVSARVGGRIVVLSERGDSHRPSRRAVTHVCQETLGGDEGEAAAVAKLVALRESVEARLEAVDLERAWRSLGVEASGLDVSAVAEAAFDTPSDVEVLATLRALRRDTLYFRERRQTWSTRAPEDVEATLRAREARARREAEEEDFVERLVSILGREGGRVRREDELGVERRVVRALEEYALLGNFAAEDRLARRLLEKTEASLGHKIRGADAMRAFWVLVELGIWDEHENLDRLRLERTRRPVVGNAWSDPPLPALDRSARTDRTGLWTCTIDDPEAEDLDDALSLEETEKGWIVSVHIADVASAVEMGSALDEWASRVATSIYLPDRTIPMLPPQLSHNALSLVEGVERPAVSYRVTFDRDLRVVEEVFERTVIEVDQRYSYDTVDVLLAQGASEEAKRLGILRRIADELSMRRVEQGAVSIDFPEIKLDVDLSGETPVVEHRLAHDSRSRSLVGEWMIAMNVAAGRYLAERGVPVLYRVQDPPRDAVDDEELAPGPARELARLKRMHRAEMSVEPAAHAGLGVEYYVQMSSPIRRYGDLVAQRQLVADLAGAPTPYDSEGLVELALRLESGAWEARKMEESALAYWMAWLLDREEGPIEGVVIDWASADRKVVAVFLTKFGYRATSEVKGTVELGQQIQMNVTRADPRQDALSLREARPG